MPFSKLCTKVINQILSHETPSHNFYYVDFQKFVNSAEINTTEFLTLPNICFWDPLSIHKTIKCPRCLEMNKEVLVHGTNVWETGSTSSLIPRTIRDVNWYVALVGRQYECQSGHKHKFVSYIPDILNQIPLFEQPFMLSHQFGVTNQLFDFIVIAF